MSNLELNVNESEIKESTITDYRKYLNELEDLFNKKPYLYCCADYVYNKFCSDENNEELIRLDLRFKALIDYNKLDANEKNDIGNLFGCLKYYLKRTNEMLNED
jgi:hypothetical protein